MTDADRMKELTADLLHRYGPIMSAREITDMMHFRSTNSAYNWVCQHGLAGCRAGQGKYYTRDIARAVVLGTP